MTKDEAVDNCVGLVKLSLRWSGFDPPPPSAVRTAIELLLEPENIKFVRDLVTLQEYEQSGEGWPKADAERRHLDTTSMLAARLTEERDLARDRADAGWTEVAALRQEWDQLREVVDAAWEFREAWSKTSDRSNWPAALAGLCAALDEHARVGE